MWGETMTYPEIYDRLNFETFVLFFCKRNGDIRVMLATRNSDTFELIQDSNSGDLIIKLEQHDRRCNINNGNVAVIDLEIKDARSFNINRLIQCYSYGIVNTKEQLVEVMHKYMELKLNYENYIKKITNGTEVDNDTYNSATAQQGQEK